MSATCRFCCKSRLRPAAIRDSVVLTRSRSGRSMMGRLKNDQGQLFYEFRLSEAVPEDLWRGRSMLLCPGFLANLRLTIRQWVARRSIRRWAMEYEDGI